MLIKSWIDFYATEKTESDLCYVSGEKTFITSKHPSKIRYSGDKAKIISSNDKMNFTYRGRFKNDKEALVVSYDVSQKAHNTLKWLIKKQGFKMDSAVLVSWESSLQSMPKIIDDTFSLFDSVSEPQAQTQKEFADKLIKTILGYKNKLDVTSKMLILILDAATPGRLSVKVFRSLDTSVFLNNIEKRHQTSCWYQTVYKDKEKNVYVSAPSLKNIAKYIYGAEQNGFIKVDSNIEKKLIERLIPCVIDGKQIPNDIVKTAIIKASNPVAYSRYNWQKILEISSAIIKKSKNDFINRNNKDKYKEVWAMALNESSKNRSYLYGRLLAVADRVEYLTYSSEENRQTNARRYMSAFSQKPYKTWQIIYKNLDPYFNKLSKGSKIFYQNLLQDIHNLFEEKDFIDNSKLEVEYILGFECQSKNLKNKKEEEDVK